MTGCGARGSSRRSRSKQPHALDRAQKLSQELRAAEDRGKMRSLLFSTTSRHGYGLICHGSEAGDRGRVYRRRANVASMGLPLVFFDENGVAIWSGRRSSLADQLPSMCGAPKNGKPSVPPTPRLAQRSAYFGPSTPIHSSCRHELDHEMKNLDHQ